MKKFGAIIALATFLTVGGVYATFNYAQGGVNEASSDMSLGISDVVNNTEKGAITIDTDFKITVDDDGYVNNNKVHNYTTCMTTTGSFVVNFTPQTGADAEVRDYGIVLEMTVEITGTNTYAGETILTTNGLSTDGKMTLNNGQKIKGDYTVDLASVFAITPIELKTHEEYDNYKAALNTINVKITIGEKA